MKKHRILKISGLIFLLITLTLIGKFYYDMSFNGNENFQLISNGDKIEVLDKFIKMKEFENSVIYIDIWGTNCIPCLNEFKYLTELKERYKGEQLKFLYLSVTYGQFNDEQKWKNMIKKYNLKGFHSQISIELYEDIMKREGIKDQYSIPHYILIDKQGNIIELNAASPSSKEKLYEQIDKLL